MSTYDYASLQKTATNLINKFGTTCTIVGDDTQQKFSCVVVSKNIVPRGGQEVNKIHTLYVQGDKKMEISIGDLIRTKNDTWLVNTIEKSMFDEKTNVVWKLDVRK